MSDLLINVISAVIGAVVGGAIAWIIAAINFEKNKDLANSQSASERRHSARLAVEYLIAKIEDSELFRVDAHYEIWDKGFRSLNDTRELSRDAKSKLRIIEATAVLHRIERFDSELRPLIKLRDSFERFMAERGADGVARLSQASDWPDLDAAADELRRLQTFVNRELNPLKDSIRKELTNN
ncbi:MAG: hypothetical protein AAF098_20005 [Pseudomonadota bacterium]